MEIKVKLSLNIGFGSGHKEETMIQVPDKWPTMNEDEKQEVLDEYWLGWSANYIDGYIGQVEG